MIFVGQKSLLRAITEYMKHYHGECNHQGLDNKLIRPCAGDAANEGHIRRRQRLGGMLNFYYYAPRVAAFEKRYAACVAWGPHYDYHAVWQKRWSAMKKDHNSVATSHFQLPWVLGVENMDVAMEKLKKFTLAGVAEKIECPMLITWGEEDRLTTREVPDQLYAATGSRDKTLKIFTRETGGFEHCQADNRQVGIDYIADWPPACSCSLPDLKRRCEADEFQAVAS
jgi:hypothetical protein